MLRVVAPSAIRKARLAAALVLVGYGCASREAPAPPPEDPQLGYARAITGFGGFFLDKQGLPTVYLRDPGQRPAAEKALAETLRSFGLAPADLHVLQGQYDYLQLHEWFDSVSGEVFSESGVVFVDVDEGANRLHVGVQSAEDRAAVTGALSRLGIPPEAAVIDVTRPFVPFISLIQAVRPALGGLRIARAPTFAQCSLGFNVMLTQKGSTRDHRRSFITNSHCTNTPGGTEETQYSQGSGSLLGTEVDDPVYHSRGSVWIPSPCPRGRKCRFSDSARVLYSSDVPSAEAGIARTTEITGDPPLPGGTGELRINGTFRISAERSQPVKGMTLHKVGSFSGWTVGKVTKTCAHLGVNIDGEKFFFFCQGVADGIAVHGDSGSPVFEVGAPPFRDVTLNGILLGGNGEEFAYSPMANIERELGKLTTFTDSPTGDQKTPDLVPERERGSSGPDGFCRRDGKGGLIVRVRNQTNVAVPNQTTTRVLFSPGGLQEQQTPAIGPGGYADVTFAIPVSCFDHDCDFTIAVDASIQIDESHGDEVDQHETNNIEIGRCIG